MVEGGWTEAVLNLENKIKLPLKRALLLSSSSSGIIPHPGRLVIPDIVIFQEKLETDFYLTYP